MQMGAVMPRVGGREARRAVAAGVLVLALASCGSTATPTQRAFSFSAPQPTMPAPPPTAQASAAAPARAQAPSAQLKLTGTGWRRELPSTLTTVWAKYTNVGNAPGYVRLPQFAFLMTPGASFKLLDAKGVIVASGSFDKLVPQVLAPGESTYLFATVWSDTSGAKKLVPTMPDFVAVAGPPVSYRVTGVSVNRATGSVTAVIENRSAGYAGEYCVALVVLDAKGKPLTGQCDLSAIKIAPGEKARYRGGVGQIPSKAKLTVTATPVWFGDQPQGTP